MRRYPRFATAYLNFGNLLARQNRLAEAEKLFAVALDRDPTLEPARRNLVRVRSERGRE